MLEDIVTRIQERAKIYNGFSSSSSSLKGPPHWDWGRGSRDDLLFDVHGVVLAPDRERGRGGRVAPRVVPSVGDGREGQRGGRRRRGDRVHREGRRR